MMLAAAKPPRTRTRPYIIAGLLVVLASFGGVGTWATFTPIEGAVIAPGVVTVHSNHKTVQHLEGGMVNELLVRDGDFVERGQILLRLDPTRAQASLAIVQSQLDVLRAQETRLLAERDGRDAMRFPAELLARAQDANVAELLRGEQQLFEARGLSLEGEIGIRIQRIAQLEDEIEGLGEQTRSVDRRVEMVEEELSGQRVLFDKGYASRVRINELERHAEALRGQIGAHITSVARAENGIGEANLQVIQLRKQFRERVVQELHEVQAQSFDVSERLGAVRDRLTRLEIRAPQSGIVVGMGVHTLGGVVGPGQSILDIVPDADELVIEARVRPQDIDKIRIGQTTIVRLSAFDRRTTPELVGSVIAVSADRMTDDKTGLPFFQLRSRIDDTELAKLGELRLMPGMPAETYVQTGARTVLSYLVKPLSDSLANAFRES